MLRFRNKMVYMICHVSIQYNNTIKMNVQKSKTKYHTDTRYHNTKYQSDVQIHMYIDI